MQLRHLSAVFAYEDISSQELKKYDYKWLRDEFCDESCDESGCFVLEQRPLYKNSGYTRQVAWYDKDEYRLQRIDYYDHKGDLLKTLSFGEYKRYLGKYWRAHNVYRVNRQTGKKTRLVYEKFEFRNGLKNEDFIQNRLKRMR